jgi:hypothetical protein
MAPEVLRAEEFSYKSDGLGPSGRLSALRIFHSKNRFCMVCLYARAGRLIAQNGGFRPGQCTRSGW